MFTFWIPLMLPISTGQHWPKVKQTKRQNINVLVGDLQHPSFHKPLLLKNIGRKSLVPAGIRSTSPPNAFGSTDSFALDCLPRRSVSSKARVTDPEHNCSLLRECSGRGFSSKEAKLGMVFLGNSISHSLPRSPSRARHLTVSFFGWEGFATKIDYREKTGTLILTFLLEDLDYALAHVGDFIFFELVSLFSGGYQKHTALCFLFLVLKEVPHPSFGLLGS